MSVDLVTPESFEEWMSHPVTRRFFKMLKNDREQMKEGLVSNTYDNEEEVKGRCRVISVILEMEYSDLFQSE